MRPDFREVLDRYVATHMDGLANAIRAALDEIDEIDGRQDRGARPGSGSFRRLLRNLGKAHEGEETGDADHAL